MIKIVCIIPSAYTKNTTPYLEQCVASLTNAVNHQVRLSIVVVSTNPRAQNALLRKRVAQCIIAPKKSGFSDLNNLAILRTINTINADYYVFINDDAQIDKHFFRTFSQYVNNHTFDVLNPIIYTKHSHTIDSFGVEYFLSGYAKNARSKKTKTMLATAACLIVKTSFLKKMKSIYGYYFNPMLHYYLEDVEFSIRAFGIGGIIRKTDRLSVSHIGSLTSQKKSYFTIYQTFRNILWVIVLTWPLSVIMNNIFQIILVQGWLIFYSTPRFGPRFYIKIFWETWKNFPKLMHYRKRTIQRYDNPSNFPTVFSPHAFRTGKGKIIL